MGTAATRQGHGALLVVTGCEACANGPTSSVCSPAAVCPQDNWAVTQEELTSHRHTISCELDKQVHISKVQLLSGRGQGPLALSAVPPPPWWLSSGTLGLGRGTAGRSLGSGSYDPVTVGIHRLTGH